MKRVSLLASERQYLDHLVPIWRVLPEQLRGPFWLPQRLWNERARLEASGVVVTPGAPRPWQRDYVFLVASPQDEWRVNPARVIYCEHGAGQNYSGDPDPEVARHPSYAGGTGHDQAILFLCPGEIPAARWREFYPDVPVEPVGCPKLDSEISRETSGCVVVSFHIDIHLCPETRSAWPAYDSALPKLAAAHPLVGHGHPRYWAHLAERWKELGVERERRFEDAVRRAALYVIDNSSTAYEAAALGVPVLLLDSPHYRLGVHHGMRFWDTLPGVRCERPEELLDCVAEALEDPPEAKLLRDRAACVAYAYRDGSSAARAAEAIAARMAEVG